MIVEEEVRTLLRAKMDREGAKVVAAGADMNRRTLYNVLAGSASEQTLRKLRNAYPALTCTTCAKSLEPIPA